MKVDLRINGASRSADVEPRKTLLDALRENFLLNGTHAGCEHGVCGACTVLVDGEPVRSCLMFAVQADGYEITTIEGLAPAPGELSMHPGCVLRNPWPAMRILHPRHDPGGACPAAAHDNADARRYRRGDLGQYLPLHRLRPDHRSRRSSPRIACARPMRRVRQCGPISRSRRRNERRSRDLPLCLDQSQCSRRSPLCGGSRPFRRRCRARRHAACGDPAVAASGCAYRFDRCVGGAGDARRALCADGR